MTSIIRAALLTILFLSSYALSEEGPFARATQAQDNARSCASSYAIQFEKVATIAELQDGAEYSCGPYVESFAGNLGLSLVFDKTRVYTPEYRELFSEKNKSLLLKEVRLIVADTAIRKRAERIKK